LDESLIFVFRDLVTLSHQTIELHDELIREHGYCWWGWWKKPIEDVPTDLFEQILGAGSNGTIFLLDCGNYLFYQAQLLGVKVAPSEEGTPSPELEKTPSYYTHLRLVVWLKLTDIKLIDEKVIKEFKYVDFPTWRSQAYDQYKGKNVGGAGELDEMRVTLWHIARREDSSK